MEKVHKRELSFHFQVIHLIVASIVVHSSQLDSTKKPFEWIPLKGRPTQFWHWRRYSPRSLT